MQEQDTILRIYWEGHRAGLLNRLPIGRSVTVRILVLGGTSFVGRAIVADALRTDDRPGALLPTSLSGDLAAEFREDGSATLDEHYGPAPTWPMPRCKIVPALPLRVCLTAPGRPLDRGHRSWSNDLDI
jgi:hypothetical protein